MKKNFKIYYFFSKTAKTACRKVKFRARPFDTIMLTNIFIYIIILRYNMGKLSGNNKKTAEYAL